MMRRSLILACMLLASGCLSAPPPTDATSASALIAPDGRSFLFISEVAVHPLPRRQKLATRLVAHAIWRQVRHERDMVMTNVFCENNTVFNRPDRYTRGKPDEFRVGVDFFDSLGFTGPQNASECIQNSSPVPMYRRVGAEGLPVAGLGTLSVLAGMPGAIKERFVSRRQPPSAGVST